MEEPHKRSSMSRDMVENKNAKTPADGPVAWGCQCGRAYTVTCISSKPPKREWVGLTLNEAEDFYEKYTDRAELINAIDKFLAEKNHG